MIARVWDGTTKAEHADEYVDLMRRTGVVDYSSTEGNRAVYLLRREDGNGHAHFRFLTLWDSMEAVKRFAGEDVARAHYYPEDAQYLLSMAPEVEHYTVVDAEDSADSWAEARSVAEELGRLVDGPAWHGPALLESLAGITAESAAERPLPGAHTIWELVLHLTAWAEVFRRRLEGERLGDPEEGDFPRPPAPTAQAWAAALGRLRRAHQQLGDRIARLDAAELDPVVPGHDFTVRAMVRGALQHLVYHTAQISLLKKARVGRPSLVGLSW